MKTLIRHHRPLARRDGFTLIEVMMASGILSFEILAVLAMFQIANKSTSFSARLTAATSLGQARVETAKNTPYTNIALPDTSTGESAVGGNLISYFDQNLTTVPSSKSVFTRTTTMTANSPITGMTLINVHVSWKDANGVGHGTRVVSGLSQY